MQRDTMLREYDDNMEFEDEKGEVWRIWFREDLEGEALLVTPGGEQIQFPGQLLEVIGARFGGDVEVSTGGGGPTFREQLFAGLAGPVAQVLMMRTDPSNPFDEEVFVDTVEGLALALEARVEELEEEEEEEEEGAEDAADGTIESTTRD